MEVAYSMSSLRNPSFRGKDTRDSFVDHLYAALFRKGLYTFKDEMIHRGKQISPELLKAIEESRYAVVVFSENYANSSWCLEELAKIMECHKRMGQKVLPVFYHVGPSDVRGLKRKFGEAFRRLGKKFKSDRNKLDSWRKALGTASNISGLHFSKSDGGESEFICKIVQEISHNIKSNGMENNLIGIESHMDALSSLLDMNATEEVRVVGILGMGGIGKTTIAQAIFRRIAYKFEGSSFFKDARENGSNEKGIRALQEKILRDISMRHDFNIECPYQGAKRIRRILSNKKVLLVLDDLNNVEQKEYLAAILKWFGKGSRIIITTRDEHLLSDAHVTHKPNLLCMDQAVQLFSRHAFRRNSPPEMYKELSYRAIRYTGNLPLALKVLGSFFHGRHNLIVWESALNRLAKTPNKEIFETLKLSFDGLESSEKQIFLDIACFFNGKDEEHVTRILDSFDSVIGITVLIERSLLTISKKRLDMHDLIQEMGRKIARDTFSNSRIWQIEEMQDLIMGKQKLNEIEAIVLRDKEYNVYHYDEKLGFSNEVFRSMNNLRLLDIDSNFPSHEPTFLPSKLRWLCWHEYSFCSLPMECMRKLVGLQMVNSAIQHLWEGQKNLPKLKFIDLRDSHNITKFPDVSGCPNIERLILANCRNLVEVHQSVGFHRRVVYMDMSDCWKLNCFPSTIKMSSLETLILSSCKSLKMLPEVSPCMKKLSKIYLDNCGQIEELPPSIKNLSGLTLLNLTGCTNLINIPNSICDLKNLKSLHLHNCGKLQKLPADFKSMQNLEELLLGLSEMWDYERLPDSIGFHTLKSLFSLRKLDLSWRQIEAKDFPQNLHAFSLLEELHLSGNSRLTQLPAGISDLPRLKLLELNKCDKLQNLHSLPPGIQVLKARGCRSLEKVGDLTKEYEWLYKIWLLDCHKLLECQETERNLDKMLHQSFLKKCAAVNHRLSIAIPGTNMPSWLKEEWDGCNIVLKLPPKCHTQIMGFAVCGVFQGNWQSKHASPRIIFKIVNDEKAIPEQKVSASAAADNGNVWISYIPFDFFQQMYHDFQPEDWSHIEGTLVMTLMTTDNNKSVRCAAQIVYREDLETIQQMRTCISDYGNLVQVSGNDCQKYLDYDRRVSGNTYVSQEKSDEKNSNQIPLRSGTSRSPFMYDISAILCK